jgi:cobalt/nickel transport protein
LRRANPGYKPWFKSFFEPASGEIESLLFASQAALGAGVVGYAIGLYKGRSQQRKREE